jgi:SulP family sulfate permease
MKVSAPLASLRDQIACNLWLYRLLPFLRWWPMVNRGTLRADGIAGLTGAVIVLPQAVAFATIAGLPPQYGLYAAMIPAIVGALWGSSRHLVSGPTTAISIIVFTSISPIAEPGSADYIRLVLTLTFLAGLFQLALGMARMGVLVNFISHTVVIGFTAGAAILIAVSQVKNFFGLTIARGATVNEVLGTLLLKLGELNPYVTAVAAATLAVGVLARRYTPRFPYMIAAMLAGSVLAWLLNNAAGAEVTGIVTVGALPAGLPPLSLPDFSFDTIHATIFSALIVTVLGLTEAVSISRAIAAKSEQRIDGNQEFIGQGLSNIFGSFFSGYASSGSFNRSGVNYEGGAQTPLAAVFASIFLILILLLVAPLAAYLPIPSMAAILFLVAWSLIDFKHIRDIVRSNRQETIVLGATFAGTLVDLEKGLFLGIMLSMMFYLQRTSKPMLRALTPDAADTTNARRKFVEPDAAHPECPQMKMARLEGSIFFGAVDHVQRELHTVDEEDPRKKRLLLFARGINFVDLAGAEMLEAEARRRERLGGALYLCALKPQVRDTLAHGGQLEHLGADHVFASKSEAIGAIYPHMDTATCRDCRARIFAECKTHLPDGTAREA